MLENFSNNIGSIKLLNIMLHNGPLGCCIFILLIIMSLWLWIIVFAKFRSLKIAMLQSEKFCQIFWDSDSLSNLHLNIKNLAPSPARELFISGFNEMIRVIQECDKKKSSEKIIFDTIKRALSKQKILEESALSKDMNLLAVCASAAPFIGLLGTVIGIIKAFHDIGLSGSSSLAAVAPGVSEALIATALGLFVAIPAVSFYNILSNKIRRHLVLLDTFTLDFLNILERHYNI